MPILDLAYCSRQLEFRRNQISQSLTRKHTQLREEINLRKPHGETADDDYFSSCVADIEEAQHQEKDTIAMCRMLGGTDTCISPLRCLLYLAVWGPTGDVIGVLSIHGTSIGVNVSPFTTSVTPPY